MKTLRPHGVAAVGATVRAIAWSTAVAGVWTLIAFSVASNGHSPWAGRALDIATPGWILIGCIAIPIILRAPFAAVRARYEITPTEVVEHRGVLWRDEVRVNIVDISAVLLNTGPLGRALDVADLDVGVIRLRAIADADHLRRQLLERRDALREAALRGDLSVAKTAHELLLERLAAAIETKGARRLA